MGDYVGKKEYTVEKIGGKYTVVKKWKSFFGNKERFISSVAYGHKFSANLWFGSYGSMPHLFSVPINTFETKEEAEDALAACIRLQP